MFDSSESLLTAKAGAGQQSAPQNTVPPSVDGTPMVGQTLTGSVGSWSGKSLTTKYVWQRCDSAGANCAGQPETSLSYALTAADVGMRIRLLVTVKNRAGSSTVASAPTAVVAPPPLSPGGGGTPLAPPAVVTAPSISGQPVVGQTLVGSAGSWTGGDPMTYAYEWQRCASSTGLCVAIAGASGTSYQVTSTDLGSALLLRVSVTNAASTTVATSSRTGVVTSPPPATPPTATTAPAISGTPQVGQTLTGSPGTWSGTAPISLTYRWRRCDTSGGSCGDVSGATGTTYAPTSSDVGSTLRFVVSASNAGGSATVASTQSATVTAAPAPAPAASSSMRVGLNANVAGYGDPMKQNVLNIGAKLIREDRGDYALSWARANGITDDCIVWLDPNSAGAQCPIVELDNEPYENHWNNTDVYQWARKAQSVAQQIKAAHPSTIVLLPIGPSYSNGDTTLPDGSTRDTILAINDAAPTIWNSIDGIAIHPYSQPSGPVPGRFPVLDKWRTNLRAIGHGSLPFYVTEIGWPTGGNNWNPGGQTEQQQSDYLGQFIDTCKTRGDVAAIFVYQLQDWGPRDTDSEHYFGLLRPDGSAKPAYSTVKQRIAANP